MPLSVHAPSLGSPAPLPAFPSYKTQLEEHLTNEVLLDTTMETNFSHIPTSSTPLLATDNRLILQYKQTNFCNNRIIIVTW